MSLAAMPVAPMLAWSRVSFGEAARTTAGQGRRGRQSGGGEGGAPEEFAAGEGSWHGAAEGYGDGFDGNVAEHDRVVVARKTEMAAGAILAGMRFVVHELR